MKLRELIKLLNKLSGKVHKIQNQYIMWLVWKRKFSKLIQLT